MSDVDALAKKLVDDVRQRCNDLLTLPDEWSELEDRIAAAIAAERAKFAAFAGPDGEPVKVLGTPIVSGDGCWIFPGAFLWIMPPHCANPAGLGFMVLEMTRQGPVLRRSEPTWSVCYSTREAATSALDAEGVKP